MLQAVNLCVVVVNALCCTDPVRNNPVASVNVLQKILAVAKSLNGLYHLEKKARKIIMDSAFDWGLIFVLFVTEVQGSLA